MGFERENRQAIIFYFEQGAQRPCADAGAAPSGEGIAQGTACGQTLRPKLGVEVEHFIVQRGTQAAITYEDGVQGVLEFLSGSYPQTMLGLEGDLIGVAGPDASLTLEPAAQLEISIAPFADIDRIIAVYQGFRQAVDPYLADHGWELVTLGYHPTARALDLPLIPKQRYRFMDDYFHALGTHGERMMRASASTQVSIDYADEVDAVRKMRVAQALVPLLAYLTDNVVRFEGKIPEKPLSRLMVWRDVDPARCGQVPGLFEEGFGFARYADWLLSTCPIFVTRPAADDPDGPAMRRVDGQSAAEAYADAPMSRADVEQLLSMFWPDVRLKHYVEIRPADALPLEALPGYAALIKGLFYSERALFALEDAFGVAGGRWSLPAEWTDASMARIRDAWNGTDANAVQIASLSVGEWKPFLIDLAAGQLSAAEQGYLERFARWAR